MGLCGYVWVNILTPNSDDQRGDHIKVKVSISSPDIHDCACSSDFISAVGGGCKCSPQLLTQHRICALGTHCRWVDWESVECLPNTSRYDQCWGSNSKHLILSTTPHPLNHKHPVISYSNSCVETSLLPTLTLLCLDLVENTAWCMFHRHISKEIGKLY